MIPSHSVLKCFIQCNVTNFNMFSVFAMALIFRFCLLYKQTLKKTNSEHGIIDGPPCLRTLCGKGIVNISY